MEMESMTETNIDTVCKLDTAYVIKQVLKISWRQGSLRHGRNFFFEGGCKVSVTASILKQTITLNRKR